MMEGVQGVLVRITRTRTWDSWLGTYFPGEVTVEQRRVPALVQVPEIPSIWGGTGDASTR
jgi:hypothetical protein